MVTDRPDTTHQCPGPWCEAEIPYTMLACREHWYQVSKPTRARVWRTWNHGAGSGTYEHTRAIFAAIREMRPL